MNYIGAQETAQKWNISLRQVQHLCANGKVPGARHIGKQWVIPADAKRPADGRTRGGKAQRAEGYHFPVFIYSPCYGDPVELDENEQRLLQAQIMRLEGKYAQSIELCQDILSGFVSPYLAAGIHLTIGFDSLLLGITSGYRRALVELERILDAGTQHVEDVRLMRASLIAHGSFDSVRLFAIDPEELSAEAAVYYRYCLLSAFSTTGDASGRIAFRYFQSEIPQLRRDEIVPAVYSFHALLGAMNYSGITMQERESHMRVAVELAIENGWVANLCKYYNTASTLIDKCLESYGIGYVKGFRKLFRATMRNWHAVHAVETGSGELKRFSNEQIELLLLVFYRCPNKTIAAIKYTTKADVSRALAELCAIVGVHTRKELIHYAETLFVLEPIEKKAISKRNRE